MLLESGMPYAFLRMNLFLDDLPLWFDPDGVCRGPGGDGRVALISREDTAAVSAGVLVGPGYENEALDLTGRAVAHAGRARRALQRARRPVSSLRAGTREAWLECRIAAGVPPWDANIGVGSYEALLRGEFDVTSDVVRQVTGTPAQSARSWVEANPERFAKLGVDARRARAASSAAGLCAPWARAPRACALRRFGHRRSGTLDRQPDGSDGSSWASVAVSFSSQPAPSSSGP